MDIQNKGLTIEQVQELLVQKFPQYEYNLRKPLLDTKVLKVMKDEWVAVVITIRKDKIRVIGFEANNWSRAVSNTFTAAKVVLEPKLADFENEIARYLISAINPPSPATDNQPPRKQDEDHKRYMPK